MISLQRIHHVAYRCKDAKETATFYKEFLNMDLLFCIAEDRVSSTKEPNAYIHIFLDAGMGNILTFFEIAGEKDMGCDEMAPTWVQHIAFELKDEKALIEAKSELENKGIEVLGVTDHTIIKSIYFFDPNGHRLELTCRTGTRDQMMRLKEIAPEILEEWFKLKFHKT